MVAYHTSSFPADEVPLLKPNEALPSDAPPGSVVAHLADGTRAVLPRSLAEEWLHATDEALTKAGLQRLVKIEPMQSLGWLDPDYFEKQLKPGEALY